MMNPIAATRRVSWFEAEGVFEKRFSAALGLQKTDARALCLLSQLVRCFDATTRRVTLM